MQPRGRARLLRATRPGPGPGPGPTCPNTSYILLRTTHSRPRALPSLPPQGVPVSFPLSFMKLLDATRSRPAARPHRHPPLHSPSPPTTTLFRFLGFRLESDMARLGQCCGITRREIQIEHDCKARPSFMTTGSGYTMRFLNATVSDRNCKKEAVLRQSRLMVL